MRWRSADSGEDGVHDNDDRGCQRGPHQRGPPPGVAAFAPAASGSIVLVSGDTLEVRNTASGQTTVDVSSRTAITATVEVALSQIKPGTCISASGTKNAAGGVKATSVSIEASANGQCGQRGAGFARASTPSGTVPGGFRRGSFPGRTPGTVPASLANAADAIGNVISVSGSTITLKGFMFSLGQFATRTSSSTTTTTRPAATKPVTVTVSSSTKYLKTQKGTPGSLKVGECATAYGSTNDIGVVAATRLTVSPATASGCSAFTGGFGGGFGGRFGGGFGGRAGGGPGAGFGGGAGGGFGGTGVATGGAS